MFEIKYITDGEGRIESVQIPYTDWQRLNYDDETEYLLSSPKNKERLLESLNNDISISKEEMYERIGIR